MLQLVLVAIGVGSLVARSDAVFNVLRLAGAAYLVLLGIHKIRDRKSLSEFSAAAVAPRSLRRSAREGFFVGATNPKGLIIFTAVLPQFIDRSQGHVTAQLALLGLVCIVIALLSDSTWAIASGTAREWLGNSTRRLERLTAGGGLMLVGLGVGLAITGRKQVTGGTSKRRSAGLLVHRSAGAKLEVLLVHPGGPMWAKRDAGAWSIPKGEYESDEEPLAAARREFAEELGRRLPTVPRGTSARSARRAARSFHAWAVEGDLDVSEITSNTVTVQWPPRSGRMLEIPEVDRAEWFGPEAAREKINPAQAELLDRLAEILETA